MSEVEVWISSVLQVWTQPSDFSREIWQHDTACVQSHVRQRRLSGPDYGV